jgi:hypothetical protein
MAHATEHTAALYDLACLDCDRAGHQMCEAGKDLATPHDHVIAEDQRQSSRLECYGVLEGEDRLEQRMNPASLGDAVGGLYDLAVERCVDLGSPGITVAGPYTDQEAAEDPGWVVAHTAARVDHEQVVGETLPQHVGTVAGDAVAGRIDGHPSFAAEGEVDDDGPVELVRHRLMLGLLDQQVGTSKTAVDQRLLSR